MRHIGLFMVRNEGDIALAALGEHAKYFSEIVVQDGTDDGSTAGVQKHPHVVRVFRDAEVLKRGERWTDGHRNIALHWILEQCDPRQTWVTLLHADEFWQDDPCLMAEWADRDGASYVLWGEFRFHLHPDDQLYFDEDDDWTKPGLLPWWTLRQSFGPIRHYGGPFFETRQFRLFNHQFYMPGKDHCVLPLGPGRPRRWRHIPRYRHYPYRSPAQCRAAYEDKVAKRYWQPDHAWLQNGDPFIERLPKPSNSPLAAWDNCGVYDGTLPNPERFWKGPPA